jgi:hypothetical protein
MTIDLRQDYLDFKSYICRLIDEYVRAGKPKPALIHFGFTFDQDGWILAYFDNRTNASRDGQWTTHIAPETVLPRPHWYEASELSDLCMVNIIGVGGEKVIEWSAHPDLPTLANILGDFIQSTVASLLNEGIFRPILETDRLQYCVEEFTGLYGWPVNPEIAKLAQSRIT